jgi:hypothetical protein
MERLNQIGSKFIFYVKEISSTETHNERKGSSEHIPSVDWSDKLTSDPIISTELNHDDSIAKIYKTIGSKRYGFEDSIYPNFIKFTDLLSVQPYFKNIASNRFILDETFNWIVDSFRMNRIQLELISYLQKRIEQETEIRTYHFPVLNLHIEEAFKIGNTKFQYFTKQYFEEYIRDLDKSPTDKIEYEKFFSKYYGRVLISSEAKAEQKKSEEIAFAEASLAMDVFRLLSPAVFVPIKIFKVDLEKRININFSSSHLSESYKEGRNILFHFDANNDPYYFTKEICDLSNQNGLLLFSDFIKTPKHDELYKLIINAISFYSFALSISDFHLRISQLIMIFEGLLLEEGFVSGMEKKSRARICKIMFHQQPQNYVNLNATLISMYQVRHQFTHKGNRVIIQNEKFRILQVILVEFLKKLILLNQNLKTKNELITHIDNL